MEISLFIIFSFFYMIYIYKKGENYISFYWIIAFAFSFILPVLLNVSDDFGYIIPEEYKVLTNRYYLIVLVGFIISNYLFKYRNSNQMNTHKGLTFQNAYNITKIYLFIIVILLFYLGGNSIVSGTWQLHQMNKTLTMLLPSTIYGSIFFAGLSFILADSRKRKQLVLIILIFTILFGLFFTFGRRIVIFPLISLSFLYLMKIKKKPPLILIMFIILFGILVIMPYMINVRTFGLFDGTVNFIDVYTNENTRLKEYIAMSTDVSAEYSLAILLIAANISTSILTLLKPIFIFIPRSIWPDKPLPLSEHLVKDLNLSQVDSMSIPPGMIGETYTYFGIIGLILCGFFWGILTAYFDNKISLSEANGKFKIGIGSVMIAGISIQFITSAIRGDTATGLQEAFYIFIPMIILVGLSFIKIRK